MSGQKRTLINIIQSASLDDTPFESREIEGVTFELANITVEQLGVFFDTLLTEYRIHPEEIQRICSFNIVQAVLETAIVQDLFVSPNNITLVEFNNWPVKKAMQVYLFLVDYFNYVLYSWL